MDPGLRTTSSLYHAPREVNFGSRRNIGDVWPSLIEHEPSHEMRARRVN